MRFLPTVVAREQQDIVKDVMNEEELKRAVKNCCSAILCLSQRRTVVKRADLTKLIKSGSRNYRVNLAVINYANQELDRTLGMRLFEFNDDRYILVNRSVDYSSYIKYKPHEQEEMTALFFILMLIFASAEEKCSELEIKNALRGLDVKEDLKKMIDNLVKKSYLITTVQNDERLYSWGPRAIAETDPRNFFESFLEIAGEGTADDWPEQKRRIERFKKVPGR